MNNLIAKIADYKRVTQSLIEKANEYEIFIIANVPSAFWHKFHITQIGHSSNCKYHICIDGKLIPETTKRLGSDFYWGGDFNYHYHFVSPEELIAWCKELPALITQANDYIHNLTLSAEAVISEINLV